MVCVAEINTANEIRRSWLLCDSSVTHLCLMCTGLEPTSHLHKSLTVSLRNAHINSIHFLMHHKISKSNE